MSRLLSKGRPHPWWLRAGHWGRLTTWIQGTGPWLSEGDATETDANSRLC